MGVLEGHNRRENGDDGQQCVFHKERSPKGLERRYDARMTPNVSAALTVRRNAKRCATLSAALLIGSSGTAHAEYYFTKSGAQRVARDAAAYHYDLDYYDLGAACRPQGERYDPNYKYHRWVCDWWDSSGCEGTLKIRGRRGKGAYSYLVLRGQRCP